jgi:hypothetical protein
MRGGGLALAIARAAERSVRGAAGTAEVAWRFAQQLMMRPLFEKP